VHPYCKVLPDWIKWKRGCTMHILFTFAVCTDTYYRLVLIWIGYIVAH